jgi:hypothetical protein
MSSDDSTFHNGATPLEPAAIDAVCTPRVARQNRPKPTVKPGRSIKLGAFDKPGLVADTPEDAAAIAAYLAGRAPKPNKVAQTKAQKVKAVNLRTESKLIAAKLTDNAEEPRRSQFEVWWKAIESLYLASEAGAHKAHPWRATLCQWVSLNAMKDLSTKGLLPAQCRLVNGDLVCDPVSVGYLAADAKWSDYDASKDNGGGREAYLYKVAEGHIRNTAWRDFSPSGQRKSPFKYVQFSDALASTPEAAWNEPELTEDAYGRVTGAAQSDCDPTYGDDDLALEPTRARGTDIDIAAAAIRAARQADKEFRQRNPQDSTAKPPGEIEPHGVSVHAKLELEQQAPAVNVEQLIAKLPTNDRLLLTSAWGVAGQDRVSLIELAESNGCTEAAMRKRVERLKKSIRKSVNAKAHRETLLLDRKRQVSP